MNLRNLPSELIELTKTRFFCFLAIKSVAQQTIRVFAYSAACAPQAEQHLYMNRFLFSDQVGRSANYSGLLIARHALQAKQPLYMNGFHPCQCQILAQS